MKKLLIALIFPVTALACDKEVCLDEHYNIPCMNQENALYRYLKSVVDEHYSYEKEKASKDFKKKGNLAINSQIEHCDNSFDETKCNKAKMHLEELIEQRSYGGDIKRFDYESFSNLEVASKEDANRFMLLFRYEDIDHFHSIVTKEIERLSIIDTRK